MTPNINCEFCKEPVDTKANGNYRRVVGWVQNRRQGGGNSITLASSPTGWAHGNCIDITKKRGEVAWSEKPLF